MVLSNVIVDVTISRRSFVFGQSLAEVSGVFTNLAACQSLHLILYNTPCLRLVFVLDVSLVSRRRKVVIGLRATRVL